MSTGMTAKNTASSRELLQAFVEERFDKECGLNGYLADCVERWIGGEHLSFEDSKKAFSQLMEDDVHDYQIGQFLVVTNAELLEAEEIAGFASSLRDHARHVAPRCAEEHTESLGDICGTGGDTLSTFNISTTIMFILAAGGIRVAKHGNRKITSRCGSADVLEELGVCIHLDPIDVGKCIDDIGLGFMFAPEFHPATAKVQRIRKILAEELPPVLNRKTVFNILGPLANPAGAKRQLMGVYEEDLVPKLALVFRWLGADCAMVVHGRCKDDNDASMGLDEVSTLGLTHASELKKGEILDFVITPEMLGLQRADATDVEGGDVEENASILWRILSGEERGPKRDIAVANAAAGLYLGKKDDRSAVQCLSEYVEMAIELVESKKALQKLEELKALSQELGGSA